MISDLLGPVMGKKAQCVKMTFSLLILKFLASITVGQKLMEVVGILVACSPATLLGRAASENDAAIIMIVFIMTFYDHDDIGSAVFTNSTVFI